MPTNRKKTGSVRTPWDTILGTKSHVRIVRVLERTGESMAVRELARRAGEHLRAVQLAVERLVEAGVVERVGTGPQQQVRLNERHPLAAGLHQLFEGERARYTRLATRLKSLARKHAGDATAVWMRDAEPAEGIGIEVGLLAPSSDVDAWTDALREAVTDLMGREQVPIEVRGWTLPDLAALDEAPPWADGKVTLLHGVLPEIPPGRRRRGGRRSHATVDKRLRDRAERLAAVLGRHPELVREARDEVTRRLSTAGPHEGKTLREWRQILESMTIPQLRRWLVGRSQRATRLRQSMPVVFARAADEYAGGEWGRS